MYDDQHPIKELVVEQLAASMQAPLVKLYPEAHWDFSAARDTNVATSCSWWGAMKEDLPPAVHLLSLSTSFYLPEPYLYMEFQHIASSLPASGVREEQVTINLSDIIKDEKNVVVESRSLSQAYPREVTRDRMIWAGGEEQRQRSRTLTGTCVPSLTTDAVLSFTIGVHDLCMFRIHLDKGEKGVSLWGTEGLASPA
jgi:hypothetical protein